MKTKIKKLLSELQPQLRNARLRVARRKENQRNYKQRNTGSAKTPRSREESDKVKLQALLEIHGAK